MKRFLPGAILCLGVAAIYLAGGLDFVDRLLLDLRFQLTRRPASAGLVLVDIDTRSLQQLEVWPWPRGYHATLLEELIAAGADRVAFDIDFSARSHEEEDQQFANALAAHAGRVILPVFRQWRASSKDHVELIEIEPLPEFRGHALLGGINIRPDTDGLVRRYQQGDFPSGAPRPGFAALLMQDPQSHLASFYIDFGIDPATIPRISYIDVLMRRFDPHDVAGKVVIVGSSAVELGDQVAVPVVAALPGPYLQALAYESLRQGRALHRLGRYSTLACTVGLLLLFGPCFARVSWRRGVVLWLGLLAVVLLLPVVVLLYAPIILDASPWVLALTAAFGWGLIHRIDQQAVGLLAQHGLMRRTETLMRHVVENSFDAIVTLDERGIVETFNRSAQEMFEYPEAEVIGQPLAKLVVERATAPVRAALARSTEAPLETVGRCRGGRTFPVELAVTLIQSEEKRKLVAFIRDITERKAHQQALEHQATHDPLTDLPNRLLLLERVQAALALAARDETKAAILLLDLDRFKEINDALGHQTGDRLLQQVASRLQTPLQATDTIARLGGDEFAVLLPSTDVDQAWQIASRLIETLKSPFVVDGLALQIDTSIGIALYPDHGAEAELLIQRADVAMYVAKRKRAGLSTYEPEQDYNSVRHLMLRGDLRNAIRDDLLSLAYQPKVSSETDAVVGVEALLRWKHAKLGMIPPDEFIGLAEHSGLIRPLTTWVMETALRQGAEWVRAGRPLTISINLSARNLLEEELPRVLQGLLQSYGLTPDLLILEITESVLMEDPARSLEVITRLYELGVEISIDDFGTGYSSLGYLMRLPAREIKIDRSFVMQMDQEGSHATLVRSLIELAHNLNLKVVAEGVESREVWQALKDLGCDIGQGYYFSKALPAADLMQWMHAEAEEQFVPGILTPLSLVPDMAARGGRVGM